MGTTEKAKTIFVLSGKASNVSHCVLWVFEMKTNNFASLMIRKIVLILKEQQTAG